MIEVKNLKKKFGDIEVLKGLTTTFETGKVNLIIGQSGSGKTVFLKSLLNVHEPTSGTILFDGRDIMQMSREEKQVLRSEIGTVFQGSALFRFTYCGRKYYFPFGYVYQPYFQGEKEKSTSGDGQRSFRRSKQKISG